ncbi:hypothetical protein C8R46DRAFT_463603 [Mycena filopes]|nr:hypothetical protein C8R46DRAFT_463603 [Mycena filopes]
MSHHHSLPDEIISEILSPALKVSDEVFSNTSDVSPFATYSESTSAYLLVCKSWLRVATPLLYNVVILRSKAQAKALALVLAQNKVLGQFIKFLRVEGGYGPPMGTILESSPNISDLFLSFVIYATDNTDGLCRGLPLINPTRLILRDVEHKQSRNKMSSRLTDALVATIPKWDRLVVFGCPYSYISTHSNKIIPPLAKAQRLHTLSIPKPQAMALACSELKKCPLRTIYVEMNIPYLDVTIPIDPTLQSLFRFLDAVPEPAGTIATLDLAPSLNPLFVPMQSASKEVYEVICALILYFAMSVPELAEDPSQKGISPRLPLLLVSKMFYRLGLPHYYTHTFLDNPPALHNFAAALSTHPWIAPHVRTIQGSSEYSGDKRKRALNLLAASALRAPLASQMTALVRVNCLSRTIYHSTWAKGIVETTISWGAFCALAEAVGSSLREFAIRVEARQAASVAPFSALSSLTVLGWNCTSEFTDLESTDPESLSHLKELQITTSDPSFLGALNLMKLNSLRRVALTDAVPRPEIFLKTHGHKLTELDLRCATLSKLETGIFEMCPNLVSLSLFSFPHHEKPPSADNFSPPSNMRSLTKITFDSSRWDKHKEHVAGWDAFITAFDADSFPNLRELQFTRCCWPTTEHDIGKSCWVRWAEMLLKRNINLTDKAGKSWRPRPEKAYYSLHRQENPVFLLCLRANHQLSEYLPQLLPGSLLVNPQLEPP